MVELLSDPARCQVMLVTLPEETPVNELVDTAFAVEDRAGVALGPIVVNQCVPADRARRRRRAPTPRCAGVTRRRRRELDALDRRGAVPRRAHQPPGRAVRAPRRAAAAAADPTPVLLHRRHRSGRDRRCSPTSSCSASGARSRVDPMTDADRSSSTQRHVVLCCGTGGVGKTTTAATLAIEGARRGRNAVVVTIDPAKRLAQHARARAPVELRARDRPRRCGIPTATAAPGGRLHALMLDTESTFDQLVHDVRAQRRAGASASSTTASTATSPARSRARRSTWRWRSSTSCTTAAASTSSSSTRRPPATRSTSSTRRGGSPACSTTASSAC